MSYDNNTLLSRISAGDIAAEEELIRANMGLVKTAAKKFLENSSGADFDDLCQIGSLGMLRAARNFDPSYGTVFSTFAVPLIIGEIKRFLRDDGPIKISRTIKSNARIISRAREEFKNEFDREPKISEIISITGLSCDDIVASMEASTPIRSLSEGIGESEELSLEDIIADNTDEISKITDKIALNEAMAQLSKEQKQIIYLRYGKLLSQSQTGQILGLTQVKVSREEKRIIERLKEFMSV